MNTLEKLVDGLEQDEFLLLTALLAPVALISALIGVYLCYSTGKQFGCYSVTPFIYGITAVSMTAFFYHLAPYIESFFSCLRHEGRKGTQPQDIVSCLRKSTRDLRIDTGWKFDSHLEQLMTDDEDEFREYSFES